MHPKTILITGASRGIGRASAILLAQQGHTVFGTSRHPDPVSGEGFSLLPLDVCDADSVQACVQTVLDRAGRLDVLINNAGFTILAPVEETSLDEAQALFDTNFFGVHRMTQAVLPILRQQRSGQIIMISSLAGIWGVPGLGMYAATKFALEGYTQALRYEVRGFGIQVALVEPGDIHTDIATVLPPRTIPDYDGMRERVRDIHLKNVEHGPGPHVVAAQIARVVNQRSPRLRYVVGREAPSVVLNRLLPSGAMEWILRRLYKVS